ncbi:hypothetical protein A2303_01990 [Candidatus Falkowbacteria bacterium RIFOXYB2_FULL_47_14]|uniref:Uncharacterized protein n=1 Tax=Candidatus Falkowbacteria bacterium RIFOXYA2_FULL_47_19 TaxID=1797994 RepID=A0A1F5SNC9_9BACT|nr:MAG: hypothetical protein A2227_06700 [Candidatus Falkowbacteria bacterium RIFOXYA2_FULL_47_19]OGF34604.1 MAG: hypothetical protein A2468_07895 [Candidatus Falkowbacteria bacterium RIFOXYC2_FULL_46_15]OGF43223.1 MAG: hypothetical protein A2303_01990 [Candidatus Falkowbacteria bacterium RIFOXYB2_FULL_47_14]
MKDKKAAAILMELLEKYPLNGEEKEAVRSAIGILTWSSLAESRIKAKKDKLEKSTIWNKKIA